MQNDSNLYSVLQQCATKVMLTVLKLVLLRVSKQVQNLYSAEVS